MKFFVSRVRAPGSLWERDPGFPGDRAPEIAPMVRPLPRPAPRYLVPRMYLTRTGESPPRESRRCPWHAHAILSRTQPSSAGWMCIWHERDVHAMPMMPFILISQALPNPNCLPSRALRLSHTISTAFSSLCRRLLSRISPWCCLLLPRSSRDCK